MKYVITGGAGFIGSNLAAELVKTGNETIIIDNLSTGKAENLELIKNKIKLEGKEFKTLRGNLVRIKMPTIRKTLFDSKLFSSEHPDLYVKYKIKESVYRGFDVTLLN